MKATRHNGRSGKHGTYDAKHNDRRFDVENDIVNIGLHFILKNVRPYAASCSEA